MSEYRREDTASWDAQEVRRAQEGRQSAPARHPQSHHTRRRRRNPVLGLGGYLDIGLLDTMKDDRTDSWETLDRLFLEHVCKGNAEGRIL